MFRLGHMSVIAAPGPALAGATWIHPAASSYGDTIYQIGALQGLAKVAHTRVRYVKPHGALYNTIANTARQAADVIAAIQAVDSSLHSNGAFRRSHCRAGPLRGTDGRREGLLIAPSKPSVQPCKQRRLPGAVIHDPEVVAGADVASRHRGPHNRNHDGTEIEL